MSSFSSTLYTYLWNIGLTKSPITNLYTFDKDTITHGLKGSDLKWSSNISVLRITMINNKKKQVYYDIEYIYNYFNDINFNNCEIYTIDTILCNFNNLKTLYLSNNKITHLHYIPINLECINIYGNKINKVDINNNNLLHIGIGYNNIADISFLNNTKKLISLDISYNNIINIEELCDIISINNKYLKSLYVLGNPICLLKYYKSYISASLPTLLTLDNQPINISKEFDIETFKYTSLLSININSFSDMKREENIISTMQFKEVFKLIDELALEWKEKEEKEKLIEKERLASIDKSDKTAKEKEADKKEFEKKEREKREKDKKLDEEIHFVTTISYSVSYRLLDTTLHESQLVSVAPLIDDKKKDKDPKKAPAGKKADEKIDKVEKVESDDISIAYLNSIEFTPTAEWRDLLLLSGIAFYLYRVEATAPKIDTELRPKTDDIPMCLNELTELQIGALKKETKKLIAATHFDTNFIFKANDTTEYLASKKLSFYSIDKINPSRERRFEDEIKIKENILPTKVDISIGLNVAQEAKNIDVLPK